MASLWAFFGLSYARRRRGCHLREKGRITMAYRMCSGWKDLKSSDNRNYRECKIVKGVPYIEWFVFFSPNSVLFVMLMSYFRLCYSLGNVTVHIQHQLLNGFWGEGSAL